MGKSAISMAIFNSYVCLPEGIPHRLVERCQAWYSPRTHPPRAMQQLCLCSAFRSRRSQSRKPKI